MSMLFSESSQNHLLHPPRGAYLSVDGESRPLFMRVAEGRLIFAAAHYYGIISIGCE